MTATQRLLAYLELVRLPNVFTAIADVAMGFFVTQAIRDFTAFDGPKLATFALLAAASAFLYMAGIVLNDVFDVAIDSAERPERPIPSGRVPFGAARRTGFGLLLVGVVLGGAASVLVGDVRPGAVAVALAVAVAGYDAFLKRTPLGPLGMGLCRFLNVLLGMSASPDAWTTWNYLVAGGIGLYIVGVTWFARTEARESNRLPLSAATVIGAAGIALLAVFPWFAPAEGLVGLIQHDPRQWHMLWALLGVMIGWRCLWAIFDPRPFLVQRAVRQCIFSLIMLDAVVTYAVCGLVPAVLILLLLLPTMFLGQFIYST